ncbi:hypothetical protein BJ165DRAFT_1548448 [Panaeolus papilionaceus]|nr:hypothetical protein BJ165DRAFT_1548448 [Panaeolus papilionaceus]
MSSHSESPSSLSHQEPVFPIEILRLIVENFIRDIPLRKRRRALCALTCSSTALAQVCNELIHRDIEVVEGDRKFGRRHRLFLRYLQKYPTIQTEVEHLVYTKQVIPPRRRQDRSPNPPFNLFFANGPNQPSISEPSKTPSWMGNTNIYFQFPNLKALSIIGPKCISARDEYVAYSTQSPKLLHQRILDHYLGTGNLTTLYLERIEGFPIIRILSSTPSLVSLHLDNCPKISYDQDTSYPKGYGFNIKDLGISSMTPVEPRFPLLLFHCPNLEHATIGGRETYYPANEEVYRQLDFPHHQPTVRVPPFRKLASLEVAGWGALLKLIHEFTARFEGMEVFPNLRSIVMHPLNDGEDDHLSLLKHLDGVEKLFMQDTKNVYYTFYGLSHMPDLPTWGRSLKELALQWPTDPREIRELMTSFCDGWKTLAGTDCNALERIRVMLTVHVSRYDDAIPFLSPWFPGWEPIWECVMPDEEGNVNFPAFRNVDIDVDLVLGDELCMDSAFVDEYLGRINEDLEKWKDYSGCRISCRVEDLYS